MALEVGMSWNDALREALFGSLTHFQERYVYVSANGRTDTLLTNPNRPTEGHLNGDIQVSLMQVLKRIAILAPHAEAHDSPGFSTNPCPHVTISRVEARNGRMDGRTRICVYYRENQFHVGFRCRPDENAGEGLDLEVRGPDFGIGGQVFAELEDHGLQWSRRDGDIVSVPVGQIGLDFPQGTILATGHPVANLISAMNELVFSQYNRYWMNYCRWHGLDPAGVKVPRGHFPSEPVGQGQ
jgi:hypothetical protein